MVVYACNPSSWEANHVTQQDHASKFKTKTKQQKILPKSAWCKQNIISTYTKDSYELWLLVLLCVSLQIWNTIWGPYLCLAPFGFISIFQITVWTGQHLCDSAHIHTVKQRLFPGTEKVTVPFPVRTQTMQILKRAYKCQKQTMITTKLLLIESSWNSLTTFNSIQDIFAKCLI